MLMFSQCSSMVRLFLINSVIIMIFVKILIIIILKMMIIMLIMLMFSQCSSMGGLSSEEMRLRASSSGSRCSSS